MTHSRATKAARLGAAVAGAAIVLSLGAGAVFAGEITGNGRLLEVQGRSECAFSGQEDLQFYLDDENTIQKVEPTRGDPGHAQSWGQIPREVRDYLTSIGLHPSVACNPSRATAGH